MRLERADCFQELREPWQRLLSVSLTASVFQTTKWLENWWHHFGQGSTLHLFSVRNDQGDVVAIAPLVEREGAFTVAGAGPVSDFADFVIDPSYEREALAEIIHGLAALDWATAAIGPLHPCSPTLAYLPDLATELGLQVEQEVADVSPAADLTSTWEDYLAHLRRKDRHELRRKLRRFEAAGPWRWVGLQDRPLAEHLPTFFRLLRASKPEKAAFMDQTMEAFFTDMSQRMHAAGHLELYTLDLNEVPVASVMGFVYRDEWLLYNSGYDPAFRELSVGLVSKAFAIQEAIRQGRKRFQFLRGNERYKYDLGGHDVPLSVLRLRRPLGAPPGDATGV